MTAMPIAKSPFQKAIAGNFGVGGLYPLRFTLREMQRRCDGSI